MGSQAWNRFVNGDGQWSEEILRFTQDDKMKNMNVILSEAKDLSPRNAMIHSSRSIADSES